MHRRFPSAVLLLALVTASSAHAAPRWPRLSWTGPADSSITVSWTDEAVGAGVLEVRRSGGAVVTAAATATATGTSELDVTYFATVTGLSASTDFEYRVRSSGVDGAWTAFRTAPKQGSCEPVRFVATGDSRGEEVPVLGYSASMQWPSIANAMSAEKPLFALHSGDFVRTGDKAEQWAAEMPNLAPLAGKTPFFLSIGNHDIGPGTGPTARFNSLLEYASMGSGTDDFYAFVTGNVLVMNLSTFSGSMDAQLVWLRTVLETVKTGIDWRVIAFHTPVWSSGAHGNNEADGTRADVLVPLLDEFGVDMVINGHDHDYERFHPSKGGWGGVPRVSTPLPLDQGRSGAANGTVYVVTGGGGALVNPLFTNSRPGSAFGSKKLHYLLVDVAGGVLTLTVRDCGSQGLGGASCAGALETVRLEKAAAVCSAASADAGTPGADAGAPEVDAGTPALDGGSQGDAGDTTADGGSLELVVDAGSGAPDAGDVTHPPASGCGCSGTAGGLLVVAGLFAALLVRRGRRSSFTR